MSPDPISPLERRATDLAETLLDRYAARHDLRILTPVHCGYIKQIMPHVLAALRTVTSEHNTLTDDEVTIAVVAALGPVLHTADMPPWTT